MVYMTFYEMFVDATSLARSESTGSRDPQLDGIDGMLVQASLFDEVLSKQNSELNAGYLNQPLN